MKQSILKHFKNTDPKIYSQLSNFDIWPAITKIEPQYYPTNLMIEIIGQQLSTKVGRVLRERFLKLFSNKKVSINKLIAMPIDNLRTIGISYAKANYIQNIAWAVKQKSVPFKQIDNLSDEEVIKALTTIKGVGPWTAEMFLIFSMGRKDVFSKGDLGIKNSIKKMYGQRYTSYKAMEKLSQKWKPYRSYACLALWAALDNK